MTKPGGLFVEAALAMTEKELVPHLFKSEYSKLVSVIARSFGLENLQIAEDIVSDTFLAAADSWPYKGIPSNPTAWLYRVAANRAKNQIKRDNNFSHKVLPFLTSAAEPEDLSFEVPEKVITDSQLQMLFAICHPAISVKAQICLALRILCGLGVEEIAQAFLTNKEVINKQLHRAKQRLRIKKIALEMPSRSEIPKRLDTVLRTLYLLFSEGYYSESHDSIVRKELCFEAMNLAYLLTCHHETDTHATNSLLALMCFHSSRLDARVSDTGEMVLYPDQDETLWDRELVEKGFHYLQKASVGVPSSRYYLEASIAYWHTVKENKPEKWESILRLYDALVTFDSSPKTALNRAFAILKVHGPKAALAEAEKLNLVNDHFYYLFMAELYSAEDKQQTLEYLRKAYSCCQTKAEKDLISGKIHQLEA